MKIKIEQDFSPIGQIANWFISAGFIMWGWNTLALHIDCPLFTYWEIFSMRMALSYLMSIIWQRNFFSKPLDKFNTQ